MTILLYVLLFIVSVAVTLGGCGLFTNAIEWLGKRLGISEWAVGSIFAASGTTLPETSIPVIAIFFGTSRQEAPRGRTRSDTRMGSRWTGCGSLVLVREGLYPSCTWRLPRSSAGAG